MDLNNIENGQKTTLRVKRYHCHGIKRSFQEIGYAGIDWIKVARDMGARQTIMNTFETLEIPENNKGMCTEVFLKDDLN